MAADARWTLRDASGLALALLLGLAATACSDPTTVAVSPVEPAAAPGAGSSRRAAPETEPVVVDLAELLDFADQRPTAPHLTFDPSDDPSDFPDPSSYLSAGWHPFESGESGGAAWTRGRDAVVEVPLLGPGPLVVVLEVSARLPVDRLPAQRLALTWNGELLGRYTVGEEVTLLRVEVPEALQRIGPNRLDLLPLYWLDADREGADRGQPHRGVRVGEIRFEGAARGRAPDTPGAVEREGDVLVGAGSVVTWALALPDQARLRGTLALDPGPEAAGSVRLAVRGEGADQNTRGGEVRWVEADLAELRAAPLEVDALLATPGGLATLSLSYAADPDADLSGMPALRFSGARIEGVRERPAAAAIRRDRYNVLVVLFDTLRADFTEPYGSDWVETPHIAALADSGVVFENAFANASWTRPSVASLMTSLHPTAHRVLGMKARVPEKLPYLPAILREAGYATTAVSNNAHVNESFGFARGFDVLHEHFRESKPALRAAHPEPERHAEYVWERYVAPALERAGEAPFFVYLHEIDPHFPYEPLPPFDALYDFGYQGNVMGYEPGFRGNMAVLRAANDYPAWLGEADVRHLRQRYAGEITYMDRYLGWLMQRLERDGVREETLVVFLSDHGEQFMEHGRWGHGHDVHEEALSIPLVFSLPGVLPGRRRVASLAQLVDVAPSILDLLGIDAGARFQGRSLLPDVTTPSDRPRIVRAKSDVTFLDGPSYKASESFESIRWGDVKLVRRLFKFGGRIRYDYALFDLSTDPDEQIDRWPTRPVTGAALRQMLERQHRLDELAASQAPPGAPEVDLDPGVRANLEALGYLE